MDPLPDRQAAVLRFLQDFIQEHGYSPSREDVRLHFGFASINAATKLLAKLEAKGFIAREPGRSRSLRVLVADPANDARYRLPVIGRIAAGLPITGGEQVAEMLDINPDLFQPRANMLFRVRGWSMRKAGIHDGDLVGVHLQDEVSNHQIVAAVIIDAKTDDPELTLKRYSRKNEIITLLSENDDQESYPPLVYDTRRDRVEIVGIYAGLLRQGAAV